MNPIPSWRRKIVYGSVVECVAPKGSLLEKHGQSQAYQDCFQILVDNNTPQEASEKTPIRLFASSFFSSPRFVPESWILWAVSHVYKLPPLLLEVPQNQPAAYGSGFFRVMNETEHEIILDSGATQTWMKMDQPTNPSETDNLLFQFGSIVKKQSSLPSWVLQLHVFYSKFLLVGAVRNHLSKQQQRK